MATALILVLLLATGHVTDACKGKAKAKAAAGATAGQDNKNQASTTINLGDTSLLPTYHEDSVIMSVGVIFFCAVVIWLIVYCTADTVGAGSQNGDNKIGAIGPI